MLLIYCSFFLPCLLKKKQQNVAHTKKLFLSRSHLTTCHSWPMAQSILETLFKQQQINSSFCVKKCVLVGYQPTSTIDKNREYDCVRKFGAEHTSKILYKSIIHVV